MYICICTYAPKYGTATYLLQQHPLHLQVRCIYVTYMHAMCVYIHAYGRYIHAYARKYGKLLTCSSSVLFTRRYAGRHMLL
jgi:hypothetical protein